MVRHAIASGNASLGIFSLRCKDDTVVAVGGDYRNVSSDVRVAAYSLDHGATWKLAETGRWDFVLAWMCRMAGMGGRRTDG